MIKIDIQNVYLDNIKTNDLFCLIYIDTNILGCPTKIYKIFKTFQELKKFCLDNSSYLRLSVTNLTQEEIKQLEKYPNTDYSNID